MSAVEFDQAVDAACEWVEALVTAALRGGECSVCGEVVCRSLCPNSPDYYSPEREREDSLYNESLSESEWMSAAAAQYEREHGEPWW
jgi:hypothetical protein